MQQNRVKTLDKQTLEQVVGLSSSSVPMMNKRLDVAEMAAHESIKDGQFSGNITGEAYDMVRSIFRCLELFRRDS